MALAYLEERGIRNEEALTTFKIGYADRTLGLRLPNKNRKTGADIRGQLTHLGIYRQSGHEHFNGSVVFPIMDEHGIITEIYGRKIRDDLRLGTAYHTYLPGPHRGIWNAAALAAKEIILCESIIDALSFWVHGFRNVTAAYGVNGFTDEMLKAFIDHRVQRVYIAYDRDDAGDKAACGLAGTLMGEGIECLRIQFPREMDANSYILHVKPPSKTLQLAVNAALWMGKRPSTDHTATDDETDIIEDGTAAEAGNRATEQPIPRRQAAEETPSSDPSSPLQDKSPSSLAAAEPAAHSEHSAATSPQPEKINVPCIVKGQDVEITLGERSYRVRGMQRNLSYEVLKVNIRALQGEKYYVDTLDLYNARHRMAYINAAAAELGMDVDMLKRDIGRVLLKLEELQDQNIKATLQPEKKEVQLSEQEHAAAAAPDASMTSVLPIAFDALSRHEAWVADFITRPPQTNETRRAIGLLAGFSRLQGPLHLLEIGASAGLNQHWDAFGYDGGHWQRAGAPGAPVIAAEWIGPVPDLPARFEIASRRACDLTPLDIEDNFDRLRVKSYIWPDQTDRLERLDKAIAVARERGVRVEAANAADWLEAALSGPLPAGTTVVYHSIAWQYFDADTHRRAVRAIEAAGTRADSEHRLAWLRYENAAVFDASARKVDHRLDMISWPGRRHAQIASVDPHGFRVELSGEG